MSHPRPGHPVRGSTTGRPIMALLDLLGRRWTLRILWELRHNRHLAFRELQHHCGGVSPSVLNTRLAELREAQLVTVADAGYALTALGRDLGEQLLTLDGWAARWARRTG